MKKECDLCHQPLTDYQVLFDRRIERMEYLPMGDDFQAVAMVLSCDGIACYCSTDCSAVGVQKGLQERGISKTGGSIGPLTSCAKCGGLVDMTRPHAHYLEMEVIVHKTPTQTSLTVLYDEGLADVCINCEPDGAFLAVTQQAAALA
ncbi:hypothetical protein [Candidatus Methylobacter favarea]|nr:hypothetical protein [Candidatus Methylobacter favarea]